MDKTEFNIKNLNKEKIFREIIKITSIYDVKYEQNSISFSVNKKDAKRVEKLLEKKYVKINNKNEKGPFTNLKKSVLRIGIIIPIFIFLSLILVLNNFVFRLEIQGITNVNKQEIINVLKEENLYGFIPKSDINLSDLENEIQKLDKVSLVSAVIKGNTLIINIKEKVYNSEYEDKDNFKPILALKSGIITEITVVQGTPLVKVGQTVQKGQELVAPYVVDTSGNVLAVKPLADIKADVFFTTTTQVNDTNIVLEDTGNVYTKRQIMWGENIIYDDGGTCPFLYFSEEKSSEFLSKDNVLPLNYITITYREQKPVTYTNYFETNKEQIIDDCKQKTRQMLGSCDIIKNEYYYITNVAGIYRVTYTVVSNTTI